MSDWQNEVCCKIEEMSMYDFMSAMGITYLHPGMISSTKKLIELCQIESDTNVLNVGCGDGATLVYLAKRGCKKIMGIDISNDMISRAMERIKIEGVDNRVIVKVGDAQNIPFPENSFDVVISEAVLILVQDLNKALSEYIRVVRVGGLLGIIEPAWTKEPLEELVKEFHDFCKCKAAILTFDKWEQIFSEIELSKVEFLTFEGMGMEEFFKSQRFSTMSRMMLKFMSDPKVRKRMKEMMAFFSKRKGDVGYVIYVGSKK